ncbi:MAG TPA: hypothetical protein PLM22_02100 [Candidatus Sabulitectum sp.]|nr:hypothetical protein [Candidatus Sabulitectum sp.]HPJ27697.1 hypothetical protein [Candidatus Sabulitectum sp.]HPR22798.1 hypothetical protein [Candidatus Sabulitectum sp.]
MNRVVVHTCTGEIIKGYTADFSKDRPSFLLTTDEDGVTMHQTIELAGLKAVFFVRSFQGNFLHKTLHTFDDLSGYGKKVMIKFRDGERFYGRVEVLSPEDIGFFIYPMDSESNTIRAFVIKDFITDVRVMDAP